LNDYPKWGVWPTATNSAYLATYNLFPNASSFSGGYLCAYDRAAMLAGAASPISLCGTINRDGGYLPSDTDGATPPLDGTPGYFLNLETSSSLRLWALSPNFANPSASTLTWVEDVPVASYSEACGGGNCIPQADPGSTLLDSLGDRLMYRLAFRMYADHESMVVNHSVTAGSVVGVRWYELQSPISTSGAFSLFQQGTFAPVDGTYRWMGSAAMDQAGDLAIGYSVSSDTIHPGIRYTGRTPADPLGTMEGEVSLLEGTGSQTNGLTRWGDYSAMRIDPADDCTFWYANEYIPSDGSFNWSTYIGSFKFGNCGAPVPDFSLASNPSSMTLAQGAQGTSTITVSPVNGFTGTVALTVSSGCPSGATCVLNPSSVQGGSGSSTLTVTVGGTTPAGTYSLVVSGNSGAHTTTVSVTVTAPDFSLSASPSSPSAQQGAAASSTITVTSINGFSSPVSLAVSSGCPANATCLLSPSSVTPTAMSTLTVTTNATGVTPPGVYSLVISGTAGALTHTTTVSLTVTPADFTISLSSPSLTVLRGTNGSLTVTVTKTGAGSTSVSLSVSGLPFRTSGSFSVNPVTTTGGAKLTISASSRASRGTFTVKVTGTSGSLNHSTTFKLTIN
jgi:hypothetical protein